MYATYKTVRIPETAQTVGTGWLPPLPDLRDYTDAEPEIAKMSEKLGLPRGEKLTASGKIVNLRKYCSPIENQMSLGSCTGLRDAPKIISFYFSDI